MVTPKMTIYDIIFRLKYIFIFFTFTNRYGLELFWIGFHVAFSKLFYQQQAVFSETPYCHLRSCTTYCFNNMEMSFIIILSMIISGLISIGLLNV